MLLNAMFSKNSIQTKKKIILLTGVKREQTNKCIAFKTRRRNRTNKNPKK